MKRVSIKNKFEMRDLAYFYIAVSYYYEILWPEKRDHFINDKF